MYSCATTRAYTHTHTHAHAHVCRHTAEYVRTVWSSVEAWQDFMMQQCLSVCLPSFPLSLESLPSFILFLSSVGRKSATGNHVCLKSFQTPLALLIQEMEVLWLQLIKTDISVWFGQTGRWLTSSTSLTPPLSRSGPLWAGVKSAVGGWWMWPLPSPTTRRTRYWKWVLDFSTGQQATSVCPSFAFLIWGRWKQT